MAASLPAACSSPPSSRPSPTGQLAFLVHSPETVANRMPPEVDNKALARQKRRRTSKEDEDILKAEYLINPKPDKATRLDIVSRVALGEKEVQIWFQNKRQNDRRRARPLEPSSSASLMSSSSSTLSDPPTEDDIDNVPEQEPEECPRSDLPEQVTTAEFTSDETIPSPHAEESSDFAKPDAYVEAESTLEAAIVPEAPESTSTETVNSQLNAPSSQSNAQPRTSWISNRRSASFVRNSEDYASEVISFPNAPTLPTGSSPETSTSTSRSLKRTHSFVRISTNEDGTARIVTDLDKTPSPPHAKTNPSTFSHAAASLRRSYSAAGLNDRLAAASRGEPSPKMARTTSNVGRSRDSRAWEFWCDPDSRSSTSLTTRAEQEGSGSAADAIGILRANRRILAQNKARQNTPVKRRQSSHKTLGDSGVKKSRGPMQRAATVNGRFSSKEYKEYQKRGSSADSDDLPQTESDKENWSPDTPKQVRRDRDVADTPPASQRARQILGENTDIMSQSSSLGALLAREREKGGKPEVVLDPEQDDELHQFMSSDRTSLSSAEEAGCVEGLLKLSQGHWR